LPYRTFVGPFRSDLIHYTAESHQPVVDALATGDPAAAALKKHILEIRSLIDRGPSNRGDARWEDHA
jgi:DNA-binding GntR family transcriptional regulator